MKKPNISGDAIKQFFFNNGEKIVLSATVVVLCLFMYSAFTSKPLDEAKSPEAIQQASRQVTDLVNSNTYPEYARKVQQAKPTSYVAVVAAYEQPVPEAAYKLTREINPPLFPSLEKRADPKIFPVEELQVAARRGLIADSAPGGGVAAGYGIAGPTPMIGAPAMIRRPSPYWSRRSGRWWAAPWYRGRRCSSAWATTKGQVLCDFDGRSALCERGGRVWKEV